MKVSGRTGIGIALALAALPSLAPAEDLLDLEDRACEELRLRLEVRPAASELSVQGERILCEQALAHFYLQRDYSPAWSLGDQADHAIDSLLVAIGGAWDEGLQPENYHLDAISLLIHKLHWATKRGYLIDARYLVDLELLCADAYLLLASHYLTGHVNPESIDPEWFTHPPSMDLSEHMQRALSMGRIRESLRELLPPQPGYVRLRAALKRYRDVAQHGGWPELADGPLLRKGAKGPQVAALRARLRCEEDLAPYWGPLDSDRFDRELEAALRKCQARYGLAVDGILGPATRAALNRPVESRIRQIRVNMERWRWIPHDLGRRYVLVNIADFRLGLYEDDHRVQDLAVIVGKPFRRTPVFSAYMSYFVLNPRWEVPQVLAVEDKLPIIQKNRAYLAEQGFEVLRGWGANEQVFDPDSLDWQRYSKDFFPFRLRQRPGPHNALGRVKFMFPNKFNVYLHDTPERALFGAPVRTFSSGCIRVEHPLVLLGFLLNGDPAWPADSLRAALDSGVERTVGLRRRVPVHLLYWTAWCEEDGRVRFRSDVYTRDWPLEMALQRKPPVPTGRWLETEVLGLGGK